MHETDHQPTSKYSNVLRPHQTTHATKKRKICERIVVTSKIKENDKQKSEWPPTDSWSWRKYGSKPIKGSPYPRGYYRCSTSKGCLAKKQVERCKMDASILIVTYMSTHNHPGLDDDYQYASATNKKKTRLEKIDNSVPDDDDYNNLAKQDPIQEEGGYNKVRKSSGEHNFHCSCPQSPFMGSTVENLIVINQEDNNPFSEIQEMATAVIRSEDLKPFEQNDYNGFSSLLKSDDQDNEFYNELEELPAPSFYTAFIGSDFVEERLLVDPF